MIEQPIFGVTKIPQNIKLELNNGTLTLKAGSKVYVPNGSGVFNVVTIASDKTATSINNGKCIVVVSSNGNSLSANISLSKCSAGPTDILFTVSYHLWYDTTNNVINYYSRGTDVSDTKSLPIAVVTVEDDSISSIDQVFDGFGYIGSTLFVLPGIEGFYANGKSDSNNLFSEVKHNSLSIYTLTGSETNTCCAFSNTTNNVWDDGFEILYKLPTLEDSLPNRRYYTKSDNSVYYNNGSSFVRETSVPYGYVTVSSSSPYNITSLEFVNPFATTTTYIVSDYAKYLANLLIIQYNNKPKAKSTIEALGDMFPDELILSVRDGFNLETANGKQLDILSKYIGAERGYTNSNNQKSVLTDEEFRILLKLNIIINTGMATLYGLENSLYNLFGTGIRVVEGKDSGGNPNMTLTYYIRSDWENIGLAAVQQNILPHPTGVGYTYNLSALTKYFGFVDYNDQNHPYSTGFRDYDDPTKAGEMYSYDKVIG